jgi:hypothetical protein
MGAEVRRIVRTLHGRETLEGAGVRLRRVFGQDSVRSLDPFLLLDHFGSADPKDYVAGFPWHPHRGIETVTYMLDGRVAHGDSLGNEGVISSGDVQWMNSGSGIIHQEMPERKDGMLQGFQLWVNIPAKHKMSVPAYRGLHAKEIPMARLEDGGTVRVVAGQHGNVQGPVADTSVDPTFLDVTLPSGSTFLHPTKLGYTTFAYALEGRAQFGPLQEEFMEGGQGVVYSDGEQVSVSAGEGGTRFLLVSGKPLREPIAWYGPIVMNRQEELTQAVSELERGDFIKHKDPILEE